MFTHDPFQAYQTLAALGGVSPYGLPYAGINPLALAMHQQPFGQQQPFAQQQPFGQQQPFAQQGIGGYSPYTQQLQGLPQQGQGWNPIAAGLQNPIQHHQLGHPGLQNPLQNQLQNPLQNPLLSQMLAYQAWQQQQTPFNYPLAPQTFIGGPGIGQPYPQINPLAQLAMRQPGLGFSPFAGY